MEILLCGKETPMKTVLGTELVETAWVAARGSPEPLEGWLSVRLPGVS